MKLYFDAIKLFVKDSTAVLYSFVVALKNLLTAANLFSISQISSWRFKKF